MSAYITFDNIAKHYHRADVITRALDGASFCVEQGELAVILGPSGAGKTTALNILGGMDTATADSCLWMAEISPPAIADSWWNTGAMISGLYFSFIIWYQI